ncbi:MAG: tryptophan--tRNA ligase [Coriobacteriales bacterium]|jgi:tryptophanyl-tRNA synthetase|nr:tryptophan--tRNA ligase [Coriobacteriales bacterium]
MSKQVLLTGDRPTGQLHLGHYVGSLKSRVALQNSGNYTCYVLIADLQALTDNFSEPQRVADSVYEVALDYLAVGLDPARTTIAIQSEIPALAELTIYYLNLVTLARVERNPTVKAELATKAFGGGVPCGFIVYPISQAADITFCKANVVPVGADQLPMLEQCREIVRSFNGYYGEVLVEPEALLAEGELSQRLPGIDGGNSKMSKSLGNAIYLADSEQLLWEKVRSMYTDPLHLRVEDPGHVEGNTVFTYLDVFAPDQAEVAEMKRHYERGGLGDMQVKKYLFEVLNAELGPIRARREEYAQDRGFVYEMLAEGTRRANAVAEQTLGEVKTAMHINYFG